MCTYFKICPSKAENYLTQNDNGRTLSNLHLHLISNVVYMYSIVLRVYKVVCMPCTECMIRTYVRMYVLYGDIYVCTFVLHVILCARYACTDILMYGIYSVMCVCVVRHMCVHLYVWYVW